MGNAWSSSVHACGSEISIWDSEPRHKSRCLRQTRNCMILPACLLLLLKATCSRITRCWELCLQTFRRCAWHHPMAIVHGFEGGHRCAFFYNWRSFELLYLFYARLQISRLNIMPWSLLQATLPLRFSQSAMPLLVKRLECSMLGVSSLCSIHGLKGLGKTGLNCMEGLWHSYH